VYSVREIPQPCRMDSRSGLRLVRPKESCGRRKGGAVVARSVLESLVYYLLLAALLLALGVYRVAETIVTAAGDRLRG